MICKRCGAPLKNNKCEYCGTNNGLNGTLMNMRGELNINGETIKVYVAEEKIHYDSFPFIDQNGKLRGHSITHRTFTLVEI